MDSLISVLFFVAIVLFQVISVAAKRAKKQQKTATTQTAGGATPGPGGMLNRIVSHIQQEMERAAREAQAQKEGLAGWEQLIPEPPAPEHPVAPVGETRPLQERLRPEAVPLKPAPKAVSPAPSPAKAQAGNRPALDRTVRPEQPLPAGQTSALFHLGLSVAELRRAFIWSEILGPPLALKQEPEDRWRPDRSYVT